MKCRFQTVCALGSLLLLLAGCEIENDNQVGCDSDDCVAYCEELKLETVECEDDVCVCLERNELPYDWSSVDTSSDSSMDSGQ